MSESELAKQLGMNPDHVSALRLHLLRLGLLEKVEVPGSRVAWWFIQLPAAIEREPPAEIRSLAPQRRTEVRRAWLSYQAEMLDRQIDARERLIDSPIVKGRERKAEGRQTEAAAHTRHQGDGPQRVGALLRQVPEVAAALARAKASEEGPPLPHAPPEGDEVPGGDDES